MTRRAARALLGSDQKRRVPAAAHAHDERLLLARGAKDVDPRVLELAAQRERVHGGEPRRAVHAELDAVQ